MKPFLILTNGGQDIGELCATKSAHVLDSEGEIVLSAGRQGDMELLQQVDGIGLDKIEIVSVNQ